ncbi:MAG TPA: ankyrin repeat domain-containing protein [Candidatus Limnocylindrales bacterium]|nr:ankyrin repeat domain-containing protein [Candidatus Limnocylindrales bacterium]
MDEYFAAIRAGEAAGVGRALEKDPALATARDESGATGLLLAIYRGRADVAAAIRERHTELDVFEAAASGDLARLQPLLEGDSALANAVAPDGFSPLGLAAFFRHERCVALLLERGADPSAASRNAMRVTPLHSAVADGGHAGIARALIEAGAALDARQRHGWTPLHGAADSGDLETVRLLLDKGADASVRHEGGKSALDLARERGHAQIAALLEERAAR